jgi:hypothetical protein
VVVEAIVLIVWWFWQVKGEGLGATLNPLETFGIGSTLIQWAVVLGILIAANRFLTGRSLEGEELVGGPKPSPDG